MSWIFTNRGHDEIRFSLALAPGVGVTQGAPGEAMRLGRKKSVVEITGMDSFSDSEDGKVLQVAIKGGSGRRLEFKMDGK